jgi:hypothetical protein
MAQLEPAERTAPTKPDLRVAATLSASLEVVFRQWLRVGLLTLGLVLLPDIVCWAVVGIAPTYLSMLPSTARGVYMLASFLLTSLYGLAATRITLADQLSGRRLTLRAALGVAPAVVPGVLAATFASYLPVWISNSFFQIGQLPTPQYLAATLGVLLAVSISMAFIGAAVAVIADEGVPGLGAVARALEVTRGHRIRLTATIFAFNAAWFLIQYWVGEGVDLVLVRISLNERFLMFWGAIVWEPFNVIQSLMWPVWMGVLYLALRRAREGVASTRDIALFD